MVIGLRRMFRTCTIIKLCKLLNIIIKLSKHISLDELLIEMYRFEKISRILLGFDLGYGMRIIEKEKDFLVYLMRRMFKVIGFLC